MFKKLIGIAGLLAIVGTISACATIIDGSTESVSFSSSPEGATVSLDGRVLGKTPLTVTLDKKSDQMIRFELDGYKPLERKLETQVNGWFFGNVIIGGLLGSTTDGVSGAMYKYSPNEYMVVLEKLDSNQLSGSVVRSSVENLKEFVVANETLLRQNIAAGEGEALMNLYALLEIPEGEKQDALKDIRETSMEHASAPAFANALADKFLR